MTHHIQHGTKTALERLFTILNNYRKRKVLLSLTAGVQYVAVVFFVMLFGMAVFEAWYYGSVFLRTTLMAGFGVVTIVLFLRFILFHIIKMNKTPDTAGMTVLAGEAGEQLPQVRDELKNAIELITVETVKGSSPALTDAAFHAVLQKVQEQEFLSLISFEPAKKLLRTTLPIIVILLALLFAFPSLRAATGRLLMYNTEFLKPQRFYLLVTPGNKQIKKGEQVIIRVAVFPDIPKTLTLYLKDRSEVKYRTVQMNMDSTGVALYTIPALQKSISYYLSAEDISSEVYELEALEQPVVTNMKLRITPPAYSKLTQLYQEDNGNIKVLAGSLFTLEIKSSKSLKKAMLIQNDSISIPMVADNDFATLSFRLRENFTYQVSILDLEGLSNADPITYAVQVTPDGMPELTVLRPDEESILSGEQRIGTLLKIKDDYGFSALQIRYRLSFSKYEPASDTFSVLHVPIRNDVTDEEVSYIWNLSSLKLATEDVVSYYFELFDNDNISGPKSVRSKVFTARIPSLDEMFQDVSEQQNEAEKELAKTLQEAEDLKKELEKISKDLKQDKKELTWEEKDRIQKTMEKFEDLQKKAENIQESISEAKDKMQENNLLSKETLEKYMEMQKMFEQLSSDDFKKAMDKLKQAMQNMDRKQTQEALQNMKMDEEAFKKSIERTLNLLKRLQIEQKMDELVKRSEEVTEQQESTSEQTNKENMSSQQQKDELATEQKQVEDQVKNLEEEMKELSEKMKEMQEMPKEELDKLRQELDKQNNEELSKEAQKDIQKGNTQQARDKQKQISQNMKQMQKSLKEMQNSMMRETQMQTLTDMMKSLDNLIKLSKEQEAQMKQTGSKDYLENPREEIRKQDELKNNLDKIAAQLSQLSQKTFAVTPEMGKELGDARMKMDKAMSAMEMRNTQMASSSQGDAMRSLNKAATLLKGGMDAMMNGGSSGGGMMSLMQQLQKMSGQQMSLNNLTQQLQQMTGGQMTPQQQAELQRLAGQQELIRKSLEELNNEARKSGKSKSIPANLEKIMKDMQEVITDMRTDKLDNNLTQQQERILSKLLDAQRSGNERDFEKNREANSGTNITRTSPTERIGKSLSIDKLKDELNRLSQEGYSRDYEELLKRYFEMLSKGGAQ